MKPGPLTDLRRALKHTRAAIGRLNRCRLSPGLTESERATITLDWMNARQLEAGLERMWAREMAADYRPLPTSGEEVSHA